MQGIRYSHFTSAHQVLVSWSLTVQRKGHMRHIIPVVTMWVLWDARNKAKHKSANYSFWEIKHRILRHISSIATANLTKHKYWTGAEMLATAFGAHVKETTPRPPRVMKLEKPGEGYLKLNIDAAYKGGNSALGGVLRDEEGTLICAMGMQGGSNTALEAEIEAAHVILH